LSRWASPHAFTDAVKPQLPAGIGIQQVYNIAVTLPSLQSQVRFAEYRVEVATEDPREAVEAALNRLLDATELPWQHQRDTGPRRYDLRALVDDLWLVDWQNGRAAIGMRLRCDSGGSGRPEQVAAALGFTGYPASIQRTRLVLKTS
jgi:radical SAM-linked protein